MIKYKAIQVVLLASLITCFFFPMFSVNDVIITGFKATFDAQMLFLGNMTMVIIVLVAILHFLFSIYHLFKKQVDDALNLAINLMTNLQLIAGMILITFLGLSTNYIAWISVGLMVLIAVNRYRYLLK